MSALDRLNPILRRLELGELDPVAPAAQIWTVMQNTYLTRELQLRGFIGRLLAAESQPDGSARAQIDCNWRTVRGRALAIATDVLHRDRRSKPRAQTRD